MYKTNNGNFKEAIVWWDTEADLSADVDVFFFIHDYEGRAKYKYGFKSLEIDLKATKEDRWAEYQSSLRRQLRRASEEGFEIKFIDKPTSDDINANVDIYNSFAEFKKLQKTTVDLLEQMKEKLTISTISKDGEVLVSHVHYGDGERTRLYQSAGTNNSFDGKVNAQANKLLTDEDMEFFKSQGYSIYDFGGIGNVEGDNTRFEGIIRFKKLFGGKEVILWKGVTPNGEAGEEVYKKYWG